MGYQASFEHLSLARRLLSPGGVCRGLLVVCLVLASVTQGRAQPRLEQDQTSQAQTTATNLERVVAQLAQRRQALAAQYRAQTEALAELKRSRGFNKDRELRAALATAQDTANQLDAVQREIDTASAKLVTARRTWLAAIDAELATATGPRARQLDSTRARLLPLVGPARKKILLPDATLDANADPEDLDQQAKAIRETETELARQVVGADAQADELTKQAELLKHHQRAVDLAAREDDQAHRNTQKSSPTQGGNFDAAPTAGSGGAGPSPATVASPSFEIDAPFVLVDVIDAASIKAITNARQSGDPAARAAAVRAARDRVKARLDGLHVKRLQIEAAAKKNRQ